MEAPVSSTSSANPGAISKCELLILHTSEAQEWAAYLQQILKSSQKLRKSSVLLYTVDPDDQPHGCNFESFQSCSCIVLLLTGVFLDLASGRELQRALQSLLHPPHRVVVLLCGVSEDDVSTETFKDWPSWRKIYAEDEPALYVSTVLESLTDSRQVKDKHKSQAAAAASARSHFSAAPSDKTPTADQTEDGVSESQQQTALREKEPSAPQLTCLTVQPNRVLCGAQETLYIIFKHKLDDQSAAEVEFSSEKSTERVSGCVENEYTLSVTAPDMPAGLASLTLHAGQSHVSLKPVTYYTNMGEVSRCLENASDPINFICQAFNLTSNATETMDNMLTDSLKSKMPATSLQLFGVKQIEEDNMSTYQRTEELPTLLHFAAKYGLKKLTATLLGCPGALQAYSVMNKHGDYPNTLAEKSGFTDLRQFIDEFVETADLLKSHLDINADEGAEVYEFMSTASQDIIMKYSSASEDIYESMLGIDPECAEDLYEVMNAVDENPEEAMLIKFFEGKPHGAEKTEEDDNEKVDETEEEEDPYNLCPEDIYDTVDPESSYNPVILNRPPAPIPRPEQEPEREKPVNYISRVFSNSSSSASGIRDPGYPAARPVTQAPTSTYDPYAGMKTPGQRQLISLQERVKVGEITVNEAVQEFKEWQLDHERRANSMRYQQENLKKLRDSITRRHKEKQKEGKELDYEISAPLQRSMYWSSNMAAETGVYEPAPRMVAPPPPASQSIQRGNWKTGSTSSTSSSESNRLSTHSTFSYSSGTEPDFEDAESLSVPPRPLRPSDAALVDLPPRIPPRIPERVPEATHERYISCPQRVLPQRPSSRQTDSPPPVPRRLR